MPSTCPASSSAVSTPGRAARCTDGRSSSLASSASSSPGVGAERVGEGLGDPARMGVHERRCARRGRCRRAGRARSTQDCSSRAAMVRSTPLTKPARAESNSMPACSTVVDTAACVFDPGAQQLVGAQPQQVQQHRVDLSRRAARGRGDDGVEQPAGAAGAVGQFGGERGVAAGDSAFAQQRGQREVGVGVALRDRAQHVERRPAGRVERLAPRRASLRGLVIDARRGFVEPGTAGPVGGVHRLLARRLDAAEQHGLRRRCRPARRRGRPESRPAPACSVPHRRRSPGPSLTRSSPTIVHAPGFGVTARIRRSTTWAGRSHRTRASSTVIFGATVTPSAGCGTGVSDPSAMPSSVVSSSAAPEIDSRSSRSPAVSVGRIVSVTTP